MFRYVILGLLRRGGALHGYAMMTEYRNRAGATTNTGSLYRYLQRLAYDGNVQTSERSTAADPRRVPYAITDLGAADFDGWLKDPSLEKELAQEDDLSARALFLGDAGEESVRELLDSWEAELWRRSKSLERARRAAVEHAAESAAHFPALRYLLYRRQKHVSADLDFIEKLRDGYAKWLAAHKPSARPARANHAKQSRTNSAR